MSNHYYTENPNAESNRQSWDFTLRGSKFRFTADTGVFSKKEVDFGSRLLIESFRSPEVKGGIADVGCGYGPIGIAIANEEKNRIITMVDVNERALELAKLNAQNNRVQNVMIKKSDILSSVEEDGFAAVVSNPPIRAGKKTVHGVFEQAYDKLAENGELWIVIQKKQGAPSAMDKMMELFGNAEVVEKKKGYYIIRSIKCLTLE